MRSEGRRGGAHVEELVEQRLNAFTSMPMERLRLLPEFAREEVVLEGRNVVIATYHESLANDIHRVIVQASQERWGGIVAGVAVSGYEFSDAGSPRKLRDEELYDYT